MSPTKKQIRKLTSLAHKHEETSEYIVLRDGRALGVLHQDGKVVETVLVERDGKHAVVKPGSKITV